MSRLTRMLHFASAAKGVCTVCLLLGCASDRQPAQPSSGASVLTTQQVCSMGTVPTATHEYSDKYVVDCSTIIEVPMGGGLFVPRHPWYYNAPYSYYPPNIYHPPNVYDLR